MAVFHVGFSMFFQFSRQFKNKNLVEPYGLDVGNMNCWSLDRPGVPLDPVLAPNWFISRRFTGFNAPRGSCGFLPMPYFAKSIAGLREVLGHQLPRALQWAVHEMVGRGLT